MDAADRLFRFAPDYAGLDGEQHARLRPALRRAAGRHADGEGVRVPSSALVAVGGGGSRAAS